MATAGFARNLEIVASALADIETLEGFSKCPAVDAKISKLLVTAENHAQQAFFSLDGSPVSSHVLKGFSDHLSHMVALYGDGVRQR